MGELTLSGRERGGRVALAAQLPSGREQAFNSYRPASVNRRGGYADLSAESKPKAIRKSRARIVEDAGAIDGAEEQVGRRGIFCENGFGMATAVSVNVCDGCAHICHDGDGGCEGAVLPTQVTGGW